ncbi:MAG: protein kinase [Myxococcales bacterium]|nr:protein kinase [Myxococcales bacterium]
MELTGRVLGGRYRIVRRIGAGGMGGVYEALQEDLGRRVAVKVIAEPLAAEPVYLERFRREALTSAQLGHPNIVTVIDFQHPPGEPPFLVMEMLDGEPLNKRLARGPFEPAFAVDVTLQILAGLEAAHARGIVHRDLKPGNVFLVPLPAGRVLVKILDFGIAKLQESETFERLTQTGVLVGTPRYAAPEQLLDSKSVDARTDIYAVGALLYCMLAGRPPHKSQGAQLLVDISDKEPTDPRIQVPSLRPELVAVMRQAMRKDRAYRFSTARQLMDALAPWGAGSAAPTTTAPTPHSVAMSAPTPAPTPTPTPATVPARPIAPNPTVGATATPTPSAAPALGHATPAPVPRRPSPIHGIHDPTHRPTPAPPKRRSNVMLGVAFGVLLGALLIAVGVGGVWLGRRELLEGRSSVTPRASSTATGTIPPACTQWEERACNCSDPRIVQDYCAYARQANAAMARGETGDTDCIRMRDNLFTVCPSVVDPSERPPEPPTARPPTSYPQCDALVQLGCSCGVPGPNRNRRCSQANRFASEVAWAGADTVDERNQQCSAEQDRVRQDCADRP